MGSTPTTMTSKSLPWVHLVPPHAERAGVKPFKLLRAQHRTLVIDKGQNRRVIARVVLPVVPASPIVIGECEIQRYLLIQISAQSRLCSNTGRGLSFVWGHLLLPERPVDLLIVAKKGDSTRQTQRNAAVMPCAHYSSIGLPTHRHYLPALLNGAGRHCFFDAFLPLTFMSVLALILFISGLSKSAGLRSREFWTTSPVSRGVVSHLWGHR